MYIVLKNSHVLFIIISITLFQLRFLLKKSDKPIPKFLKTTPHVNDTLLLVTGISLAYMASINPMESSWLLAKIMALFLYIGFGMLAMKSQGIKSLLGYTLATLTFIFIVLTALNKAPFLLGT